MTLMEKLKARKAAKENGEAPPEEQVEESAPATTLEEIKRKAKARGANPPPSSDSSKDAKPSADSDTAKPSPEPSGNKKKSGKRTSKKRSKKSKAGAGTSRTSIVLMDSVPYKGELGDVQHLGDILSEVAAAVAEKQGVPHWALVEYGQGPALLAQAFQEYIADNPLSGVILVDSYSAEAKAVKDVLYANADVVVRGLK